MQPASNGAHTASSQSRALLRWKGAKCKNSRRGASAATCLCPLCGVGVPVITHRRSARSAHSSARRLVCTDRPRMWPSSKITRSHLTCMHVSSMHIMMPSDHVTVAENSSHTCKMTCRASRLRSCHVAPYAERCENVVKTTS